MIMYKKTKANLVQKQRSHKEANVSFQFSATLLCAVIITHIVASRTRNLEKLLIQNSGTLPARL